MTIEEKRRELFDAWASKLRLSRLNRGHDEYTSWELTLMNLAFNAALDAVVIELPDCDPGEVIPYGLAVDDCRTAIESTGLGLKVLP